MLRPSCMICNQLLTFNLNTFEKDDCSSNRRNPYTLNKIMRTWKYKSSWLIFFFFCHLWYKSFIYLVIGGIIRYSITYIHRNIVKPDVHSLSNGRCIYQRGFTHIADEDYKYLPWSFSFNVSGLLPSERSPCQSPSYLCFLSKDHPS